MIEWYRPIMALHVIAVISWMAGILYLYRLLVYCAERRHDHAKVEELLKLMSRNLWKYITRPAMIVAWIAGLSMFHLNPGLIHQPWFHVKLLSVVLITISTFYAGHHVGRVQRGESLPRGKFFRIMNEVPTLLMIIVVIMVIVRPFS